MINLLKIVEKQSLRGTCSLDTTEIMIRTDTDEGRASELEEQAGNSQRNQPGN